MTRTTRRLAVVAMTAALLVTGAVVSQVSTAQEGPTTTNTGGPIAVGELPELAAPAVSPAQRLSMRKAAITADATPAVAPEDCLTVTVAEVITERYAGADRYETSVCTSFWTWLDHDDPEPIEDRLAQAVVLARGDMFPDALAGGPLAAQVQGPLLLTRPTQLLPGVMTEIQRVLAPGGTVYLLGGTGAISSGVQAELQAAGYVTQRLAGATRYETAIEIAEAMPLTSNFFFVTGRNFPDALAAGTAAAALTIAARSDEDPATRPFALMLTQDSTMPASTSNFVFSRGNQLGVWALITAGGFADAAAAAAFGEDFLLARVVGINRFETATDIADLIFVDQATGVLCCAGVGLATGLNFPDALGASGNLAPFGQPLLLTRPTVLSPETDAFLVIHAGDAPFLSAFGGTGAISDAVLTAATEAFTPPAPPS